MQRIVLGFFILVALTETALGQHFVQQQVDAKVNGVAKRLELAWSIGNRGFKLDTSLAGKKQVYIFNGRVFYICGQLAAADIAFLKSAKFSDAKVLAALSKGACQEAPLDFVVKFFLSPYLALLDESASDGLKTNLVIKSLSTSLDGRVAKQVGTKCVGMKSEFQIEEKVAAQTTPFEAVECHAPSVKWRQALAMELRKKLMMQPNGRLYQKEIQSDAKSRKGMMLSGKIEFGSRVEATIKTSLVEKRTIKAVELKTPPGYQVVDLKTEAMKASLPSGSKSGKQTSAPASALIQLLLIGGNPGAALINAAGEK